MQLNTILLALAVVAALGFNTETQAQISNGIGDGYTVVGPVVGQVTRYGAPRYGVRSNSNVLRFGTRRAGVLVNNANQSVRIGTPRWGVKFGGGNLQVGRLNRRW